MNMNVKIGNKMTIETFAHSHDGSMKTAPCKMGEWYGGEVCDRLNLDNIINNISLPSGEYKVTVVLEKISE